MGGVEAGAATAITAAAGGVGWWLQWQATVSPELCAVPLLQGRARGAVLSLLEVEDDATCTGG